MGNGWGGLVTLTLDLHQLSCPVMFQRSNLQSLSKTHVISKDATQAIAYIVHQPMIASSMHARACKKIAWDGVSVTSTSFVFFFEGWILQKFRGKKWFAKLCFFLIVKVGWAGNTQQKDGTWKTPRKKKRRWHRWQPTKNIFPHQAKFKNSYKKKKAKRSSNVPLLPPLQLKNPQPQLSRLRADKVARHPSTALEVAPQGSSRPYLTV